MRAAILQNSIGIGGRSKVLAEAIPVLESEFGSIDILTLSAKSNQQRFLSHYGINKEAVNIISYPASDILGTIYQQPFLNFLSRNKLCEYDLVFNSNNCIQFLPDKTKYIHYIHFPGPAIPGVDPKYKKWSYRILVWPFRGLSSITDLSISGNIFANSKYTKRYVEKTYDNYDVDVLYPPALRSAEFNGYSGNGVVSLGSFHPNKRQLFQLKIAKEYPDTKFRIIGSKVSERYFKKCLSYIHNNELKNVTLYPDATEERVTELLEESRIFLHTMKNEKFGIATVEALNHGCVPIVHNSGGQQEIVPDPVFRFNSQYECMGAINEAMSGAIPDIPNVTSHLSQYTEKRFKDRLRVCINHI